MVRKTLGDDYTYAVQEEQLGTGHAVMSAENKVIDADNILVLYADHPLVTPSTIRNLVDTHVKSNSILTMATATVPDFSDWREAFMSFGRFIRDENNNIIKIVEAKDATEKEKEIKEVNPAYMCFRANWMWKHLHSLKNDNNQNEYYLTDLVKMAFDEKQKIESISIDPKEALGVNTKDQLELIHNI
jgi:bifunctional UDP-N-acetylglucosamine pyrophosphorylase/glucosamine-1-phosphate N-acetyltransferase